jgi:hypothetical protein
VVIRRAKPPKINITHEEKLALGNLRENENITILRVDKVDKGNTTIVLNRAYCERKVIEHLTTNVSYGKLECDMSNKADKEVTKDINN